MANNINPNLPKDKDLANKVLDNQNEIEKLRIERGWIGRFWGNNTNISHNIAGLLIIILLLIGIIHTYFCIDKKPEEINISIKDFWAIITPLITLSIGFLFGENSKKNVV